MRETLRKSRAHHLSCSHRRRRELLEVRRTHTRVSRGMFVGGIAASYSFHKKIIHSLQPLHCHSETLIKWRIDKEETGFHSCPKSAATLHSVIVIVRLPISCGLGISTYNNLNLVDWNILELRSYDLTLTWCTDIGKSYKAQKKKQACERQTTFVKHPCIGTLNFQKPREKVSPTKISARNWWIDAIVFELIKQPTQAGQSWSN